jgi:hypothetical protein
MIHNTRHNFFSDLAIKLLTLAALVLLGTGSAENTSAQSARNNAHGPTAQQPLYTEYRGVRVGMKAQEVRTKLGEPLQKADDGDFYIFSEGKEMAQIAYDASQAVTSVSVDYLGGVGAPDPSLVVGPNVEVKPDGSIYKLIRYDSLGVWVYYNRTGGAVPIVTITIQKSFAKQIVLRCEVGTAESSLLRIHS